MPEKRSSVAAHSLVAMQFLDDAMDIPTHKVKVLQCMDPGVVGLDKLAHSMNMLPAAPHTSSVRGSHMAAAQEGNLGLQHMHPAEEAAAHSLLVDSQDCRPGAACQEMRY